MKKQLILTICILCIYFHVEAQITFQRTYSILNYSEGYSVQQTTDGGFIIAGTTANEDIYFADSADIFLIKTDAYGDTLWTRTFGGTTNDVGKYVRQTTDGGYIIAGFTRNGGIGYYDALLIKTDANGNLIWNKNYQGSPLGDAAYCVQQTSDGGYIMVGATYDIFYDDLYMVKTDSNGNKVWSKTFYGSGGGNDRGNFVQQTTDGGFIVCGKLDLGTQPPMWLFKVDSLGNLLWTKRYGLNGTNDAYQVKQTTDGGYILVGITNTFVLIKTNSTGDTLWTKKLLSSVTGTPQSIQQTTDQGYIITGYTTFFSAGGLDVYLIKTDSIGNIEWAKTFGGTYHDQGYEVQQTADGGFVIAGLYHEATNHVSVYLIKTDVNGNSGCNENIASPVWANQWPINTPPVSILSNTGDTAISYPMQTGSGALINTYCLTVGIDKMKDNNPLLIMPNPTSGFLKVEFEVELNNGNIELFNILGERVYSETIFRESKKEINLKNISQGIYFVKVFDGEKSYCKKLIVE